MAAETESVTSNGPSHRFPLPLSRRITQRVPRLCRISNSRYGNCVTCASRRGECESFTISSLHVIPSLNFVDLVVTETYTTTNVSGVLAFDAMVCEAHTLRYRQQKQRTRGLEMIPLSFSSSRFASSVSCLQLFRKETILTFPFVQQSRQSCGRCSTRITELRKLSRPSSLSS